MKTEDTFPGITILNKGRWITICKFLMTLNIFERRPYNHIDETIAYTNVVVKTALVIFAES